MNRFVIYIICLLIVSSCKHKDNERIVTPWGEVIEDSIPASDGFSVSDMLNSGEMIILTLSGPQTYYDYRGKRLGVQYLMCEKFAREIGVAVRVELCKDTAEMVSRLCNGEADIIAYQLDKSTTTDSCLLFCGPQVDSLHTQWAVSSDNKELAVMINEWYKPDLFEKTKKEERQLLAGNVVRRRVYAPFLNKSKGIISHYDHLFKKHAPTARWDWRLIAAQCYQESCFDPQAKSWAGAMGLMQIMPQTAKHLGLPLSKINHPESNVAAATRYINELTGLFRDIPSASERQLFVLAAYNGGHNHVRDAMALTRKYGGNQHRWKDVAKYVLLLREPQFYNDPVVRYGYMRGDETVTYVDRIRQRYAQYRGVPYSGPTVTSIPKVKPVPGTKSTPKSDVYDPMTPRKAKKKHRFKI
ncbi:MAG: transglycosylase SLT domain-containing protein [Prevotella sp.]|nr:transglycosylase SLT domain-containing protein [Prevotella sp.]MBO5313716.1 transglycosylase SLT domain-containing protein [Prevotella sp.]